MIFNVYNILIIAGIIQGFIFTGIVIYAKKYHSKSTFFLASLILCYSLINLMYVLPDIGLVSLNTMYAYVFLPFAAIISPIIYFYVISFLYPLKKITIKEKLLVVPFLAFLFLILLFRLRVILGYDEIDPINTFYSYTIIYHELFSIAFSIVILIAILVQIHKYEIQNIAYNKTLIQGDIKWLKTTVYIIFLLTVLWGYLAVKSIYFTNVETVFYSLWMVMTVLIYWLGHIGVYKYGIFIQRKNIRDINVKKAHIISTSNSKNEHIKDLENFLITEKGFLDSKITLNSVAERLKLSTSYLSRIIHSELNTSFTDYLHVLRVKEAKLYLSNPEFLNYTMTSLGLEAGFNSKSAFYSVFKKATNKTPKAYKKAKSNLKSKFKKVIKRKEIK